MTPGDSTFTANNLKLDEIIDLYEVQYEELPQEKSKRTKNDLETIDVDIKRHLSFEKNLTEEERELFKKDLKKLLTDLPLEYVQSMSDIVGILMYFYYTRNKHRESLVSLEERENTVSAVTFEYKIKKKASLYDPELYDTMLRTIYNILKHKYLPLIENRFRLYMKYNSVFMKVMKKRGIKVPSSKSMVYTNSTLTWFSRSLDNIQDVYRIFAIIISCPLNTVFLFLIHYFEEIENKRKIKLEKKEIMKELLKLEQEFLKVQNENNDSPPLKSKKGLAMALAAGAVITGAIIFKAFKK